ncbi:glycosyltransferase [Rheinheimera riviphila]|uniref:Glycosyltransferase n=1 Tax=Rheinheimera riviphila TaxID=1834037 RepID=A0A437QSG0_9GAMM|nr:glycosyltransferase family 4 protein [Rheinheimera riviphila]RVU37458.1 glycosyltransferase [Rheinheimera riviphila]
MAKRVLMVGQFPPPVTGEGQMNMLVERMLKAEGLSVAKVDSCIIADVNQVGQFSLSKFWRALQVCLKSILFVFSIDVLYLTPGQTLFGLLRFLPVIMVAALARKQVILHWHGYGILPLFKRYPRIARCYFNQRFINVVLTHDLIQKLAAAGINTSRTVKIANFSELPVQAAVSSIASEQQPVRLKVLFLGGLMAEKGIDLFLQAAASSAAFDFIVCGAGDAEITERVQSLADEGKLTFAGLVQAAQKQHILNEADIFVLQTHYPTEGVPLTILEAMASGCAIVTTQHNGIPETVGEAAFFVEAQSVESLLAALKQLDQQRQQLLALQQLALQQARQFSYSRFKDAMLPLFYLNSSQNPPSNVGENRLDRR